MSVQFPMSYFSDGVGVAVLVQDGVNIDEIADVNAIYIDECGGDAHWLIAHVNFDNKITMDFLDILQKRRPHCAEHVAACEQARRKGN